MTDLEKMKTVLREADMPMFSDVELTTLLEESDSVNEAIYKAAILKSENTKLTLSGVAFEDTSLYFLRIARAYRPFNTGVI